jgi:hypothetical protein
MTSSGAKSVSQLKLAGTPTTPQPFSTRSSAVKIGNPAAGVLLMAPSALRTP